MITEPSFLTSLKAISYNGIIKCVLSSKHFDDININLIFGFSLMPPTAEKTLNWLLVWHLAKN